MINPAFTSAKPKATFKNVLKHTCLQVKEFANIQGDLYTSYLSVNNLSTACILFYINSKLQTLDVYFIL